jgi:hypothetical protein
MNIVNFNACDNVMCLTFKLELANNVIILVL